MCRVLRRNLGPDRHAHVLKSHFLCTGGCAVGLINGSSHDHGCILNSQHIVCLWQFVERNSELIPQVYSLIC